MRKIRNHRHLYISDRIQYIPDCANKLNEDGVPIPSDYYYAKLGKPNPRRTRHMWSPETVRQILHNYTYLGHLVVLEDIRSLAQLVVEDEEKAKAEFLARKAKHHEEQYSVDTKRLTEGRYRLQELDTLIQNIYEDKVLGKVSEDVAMKLIAKYEAEQKELSAEVADLEEKFSTIRQDEEDVTMFMERLRKYTDVQDLTREMCLELIEYITLDAYVEGQPREIYIYYKLLDEPLKDKRSLL